jgi:hypothetical protein
MFWAAAVYSVDNESHSGIFMTDDPELENLLKFVRIYILERLVLSASLTPLLSQGTKAGSVLYPGGQGGLLLFQQDFQNHVVEKTPWMGRTAFSGDGRYCVAADGGGKDK